MDAKTIPTPAAEDTDAWLDQFTPDELLDICCPAESEPEPITHTAPTGALKLRDRLRAAGKPITDALDSAAGFELSGLDALRAGHPRVAAAFFAAADRRIERAATQKAEKAKRRPLEAA